MKCTRNLYQDRLVRLGSGKDELVPSTTMVGRKEAVDHQTADQRPPHVVLEAKLEKTVALNLRKKVEEI